MRRGLFCAAKDVFIEEDLKDRNSKDKRSSWLKKMLKLGNKRIRKANKNIDCDAED